MSNTNARLTSLDDQGAELESFEVQFNPTTLRLQISNRNEPATTAGREPVQHVGTGATVLSVELIFDTADEGTTDAPRSVRERTAPVEALIRPRASGREKQAPPRVRFEWGDTIVEGVVDSLNVDFDFFASNGVPLRAKIGLTIRQQDPLVRANEIGPGANSGVAPPGQAGLGAGLGLSASVGVSASLGISAGVGLGASASLSAGVSASASARAAVAIGGESAAEFAARVGVDPAAWRGIAAGQVDSPLSLPAGAEIAFDTRLSASPGLGVRAGAEAGARASLEASFGLAAGPGG
ncbi:MAG TPA: hypothetical protein VL242_11145, partial [Sorangium sp.]|nr:hypothetical protein [Sorangium sp.]